jgi:hypothetical protein
MMNIFNYYTKASILALIIVFSSYSKIYAQEEASTHPEGKHLIALSLGYSYIPKGGEEHHEEATGVFVPSIGLDYFFKIHQKWEIGLMADFELGNYVIIHKELNRENAFVVAGAGAFKISNHWTVFSGVGIEIEKNKNFAILRLGSDYSFSMGKGWIIAPGFFYDIKEGYGTWSFAVAIGKGF